LRLYPLQTAQNLAGTWTLVAIETVSPDGKRSPTFGPDPKGQLILTATGQFSQIVLRNDLPKFASGNRFKGTPDENAAIVHGSNASFGTWSLKDKVVTLSMDGSVFPSWTGTVQSRPISSFSRDEIRWTVPTASIGGRIETVWKRLK
jgi:hypothetical protein